MNPDVDALQTENRQLRLRLHSLTFELEKLRQENDRLRVAAGHTVKGFPIEWELSRQQEFVLSLLASHNYISVDVITQSVPHLEATSDPRQSVYTVVSRLRGKLRKALGLNSNHEVISARRRLGMHLVSDIKPRVLEAMV